MRLELAQVECSDLKEDEILRSTCARIEKRCQVKLEERRGVAWIDPLAVPRRWRF